MTEKDYERKANIEKITTNEFDITTDENNFIVIIDNGVELSQIQVCDLLNIFRNENEQLKSVVNEVIELLSEEVDLFSDKATEHDINAYIELKELDNKDAYYIATATKKSIKLLKGVVDDY